MGLAYPVVCVQEGCITRLSVYNACRDGDCLRHCKCPSTKEQQALSQRLEKHAAA
jgi:hypothetical protein